MWINPTYFMKSYIFNIRETFQILISSSFRISKLFSNEYLLSHFTMLETQVDDLNDLNDDGQKSKRLKLTESSKVSEIDKSKDKIKRKKFAILLGYSGSGYYGLQVNQSVPTVEGALFDAFCKTGIFLPKHAEKPQLLYYQRASRTDKGVSAIKQILSCQMPVNFPEIIPEINAFLDPKIRVLGAKRVTKYFDAKNFCDARTYAYLMPSYSLCSMYEINSGSFRVSTEILDRFNEVLSKFLGTHNFFNYTSQRSFSDSSSKRHIISFECGEPFLRDNMEFIVVRVKGQSFMLHQIRKMIGLAIAICRDCCSIDVIEESFKPSRLDIPKAPGLGLVLEEVHYDKYNYRFGGDGIHEPLVWDEYFDEIAKLRDDLIFKEIIDLEVKEYRMMSWLNTLTIHSFSKRESGPPISLEKSNLSSNDSIKIIENNSQLKDEVKNGS